MKIFCNKNWPVKKNLDNYIKFVNLIPNYITKKLKWLQVTVNRIIILMIIFYYLETKVIILYAAGKIGC